jgi:hypothetical protein
MSKRSSRNRSSNDRTWEGAGLGLDVPVLYPLMSTQPLDPAEILEAMVALRPPRDKARATSRRSLSAEATAALDPRKPGRPRWTRSVFEEHWEDALAAADKQKTIAEIAFVFVGLDGSVGVNPEHLRSLVRRWRRGQLPE